jgi:CubicO group peptidase (beta-lactamase class C family)
MMLWEEGLLSLSDPVHKFIPSFATMRVHQSGSFGDMVTVPAVEPVRIRHLLTHTAGLTVTGLDDNAVDGAYRAAGIPALGEPDRFSLEELCECLASLPLLFQPGTAWNYSHATDVLGRVIEVAAGRSLESFMGERIFAPLGMDGTGFRAPASGDRLAALYHVHPETELLERVPTAHPLPGESPKLIAGGHGLISTAPDYHRFVQMLAGGGVYREERLLAPRTLQLMAANHLPANATLSAFGHPPVRPAPHLDGRGFGLGFAPLLDPVGIGSLSSAGEFGWGGAAGTNFWVDPDQRLSALFMTQVMPLSAETWLALKRLVHQAIVD